MSYRYRAYPGVEQIGGLFTHASHARFVWNLACEQQSYYRVAGRVSSPPNSAARFRQLAEARADSEWLAAGSSSVQQQALRDYDQAVRNWLGHKSHRKPSWRKAGRDEGFCIRDVKAQKVNRRWGRVFVPKVGWLRFRLTRPLPVKSGMARVTLDQAGRWHVSFTATQPVIKREPTGSEVGIDRGVATTLALSTGQHYQVPHSRKSDRKARKLAARMSRARRGSKRRDAAKHAFANVHAQAGDRRKNWIEKTTTTLIRDHDVIVLEDLKIKNMVRKPKPKPDPAQPGSFLPNLARAKAGLNRSIHRSCWGLFAQRLQDKAAVSGVTVITVNPSYSSQQCRACGHTAAENRQSQTDFCCMECGYSNHADTNAAQVVLARGIAALRPPQDMGQELAPARSARGNPEKSVARTTRTKAVA
ncbi:MAG: transposase [Actinobacteria bacterium]|nr:transposase [Actinomycetota bacterium]